MNTDKLAQVLAEHNEVYPVHLPEVWHCGGCGHALGTGSASERLAAHQASVVLAHLTAEGWAKGHEEYGVQFRYGIELQGRSKDYCHSAVDLHRKAYGHLDTKVVRRRVTDWEDA